MACVWLNPFRSWRHSPNKKTLQDSEETRSPVYVSWEPQVDELMLSHLVIHDSIQERAGAYRGEEQIDYWNAPTGTCSLLSQNIGKKIRTIMTIDHILNWGLSNLTVEWFLIFI